MKETENTGRPQPTANSGIIAKNTLWSGVEVGFSLFVNLFTSIAIARIIGKDDLGKARLGSYQYIVWLTTITLSMGTFGLPATTRKYMAEYLNKGNLEIARATYSSTLRLQTYISLIAAAIGLAAISWLGDPGYFVPSVLLVAAIVPRLIALIPSQANNASEVVRRNAAPGVIGVAVTAVVTGLSLYLGWEFVGLALAAFLGPALECVLKLRTVEKWLGHIRRGVVAPELRKRMWTYSGQSIALVLLALIVWDRSDILILKAMNPDTRQITFFSLPFSLVERVLTIPTLFAGALGFTMMAQYGRGEARLKDMTVDGGRYALMIALPLLLGMACISGPLVELVYGPSYRMMIPTLTLIALLAIPKALAGAPCDASADHRKTGISHLLGMCLRRGRHRFGFSPRRQAWSEWGRHRQWNRPGLAALGIWIYAWRVDRLDLKLFDCGRLLVSGAIMAAGVSAITRAAPGLAGLFAAVFGGAALWLVSLRFTAALKPQELPAGSCPSAINCRQPRGPIGESSSPGSRHPSPRRQALSPEPAFLHESYPQHQVNQPEYPRTRC